jgi:molecular chaperone DnaK
MVKEAEEHAQEDKKRREQVEARNHADALIHDTEKNLKEHGDKVPAADKEAVEQAISDLREVIDGDDGEAIKAKTEALGQASMKLGEAIYKASQAEADASGDGGGGGGGGEETSAGEPDEKVVDAEFEEVDPDKDKKAG